MSDQISISFNGELSPKAQTEKFKIYANVGTTETPTWELQGRGVASWTIDSNGNVEKATDVLGLVDMERGTAQPTQTGVELKLRSGSQLGLMLFKAWVKKDFSELNAMEFLQKFEFVDGISPDRCLARKEKDVLIDIVSFSGEANGYLGFVVDIHYANNFVLGDMSKVDGATITFTEISDID